MDYNECIKNARLQKGLNQEETANLLGITRGCYAHYEQGIREPSIDTLKKLCDLFDVSADYLIGRSDY